MVSEYSRWGYSNQRILLGFVQMMGGIGLIAGINNSIILSLVSFLLTFMMITAVFVRIKIKDNIIQMFPAILAISAVYVIMERVYKFAPEIGLGTQPGLLLVYLGGAMGVNIWLLKGFVDSIPAELDEAAKIDGASEVQTRGDRL